MKNLLYSMLLVGLITPTHSFAQVDPLSIAAIVESAVMAGQAAAAPSIEAVKSAVASGNEAAANAAGRAAIIAAVATAKSTVTAASAAQAAARATTISTNQ